MIVARNIRCVTNVARNILLKNGGYVVVPARPAAFKSELKIKWVRPVKIPSIRPEKSGDGGLDLKITGQDFSNYFEHSKELQDADDLVKKMFTLEFLPRKEIQNKKREKTLTLVKRHAADRGSMESRLAAMTSEILDLQEHMIQHPRNKQTGHFLKELIDKRKKFLGKLRRWDYKRFEWVLDKLNLVYKPHPPMYGKVTRKRSMRALTKMHCLKLKREKLYAYRLQLANERRSFLVEKVQKLEFIRNEEIACGKEPTVTEEAIEEAKSDVERSVRRFSNTSNLTE